MSKRIDVPVYEVERGDMLVDDTTGEMTRVHSVFHEHHATFMDSTVLGTVTLSGGGKEFTFTCLQSVHVHR